MLNCWYCARIGFDHAWPLWVEIGRTTRTFAGQNQSFNFVANFAIKFLA